MKNPFDKKYLPTLLFVVGSLCILLSHILSVSVILNGLPQKKTVFAFTVNQAVRQMGIQLSPGDRLKPGGDHLLLFSPVIKIDQLTTYRLYTNLDQAPVNVLSTERKPGNLYGAIGLKLFPGDRVLLNGQQIDPSQNTPYQSVQSLQVLPGSTITLETTSGSRQISSSQPTVGLALQEFNLPIQAKDYVGYALDSDFSGVDQLGYYTASPYSIQVDGETLQVMASAKTTGAALANAGIALQGLDYSIPPADQPLPPSGSIQVVRVQEEIILNQTNIAYESTFVGNPEVELDQREITKAGQYGIKASRERIRYEDGSEVFRVTEAEWTAVEPVTEEISYGQKVVVRTLSTPQGELEYWRAVTVYATAYSPCRSAADRCYYGTSYGLPVKQGVIGVIRSWYYDMAGQSVYVPGYGTAVIADVGGGIAGKHWIDLGYTDEEYETMAEGVWPQTVTMYFLTPVPDSIPWVLP
jgi:resuscitation-promoting factor RpfB